MGEVPLPLPDLSSPQSWKVRIGVKHPPTFRQVLRYSCPGCTVVTWAETLQFSFPAANAVPGEQPNAKISHVQRKKHFRKASLLKRMRQTVNLSCLASPTAGKVPHFRFPPSVFPTSACHHRKPLTDGPNSHSRAGNPDNPLSLYRNSSHRQASLPTSVYSLIHRSPTIIVATSYLSSFKKVRKNQQQHEARSALFNNASGSCLCQRAGNGLLFSSEKIDFREGHKVAIRVDLPCGPSCPAACSQEQHGPGKAAVR